MKLVAKIFVFLLLITQFSFASYIDTDAEMAVVIDADTGTVLFEKNSKNLDSFQRNKKEN